MKQLIVVANIIAIADKIDLIKSECERLLQPTRAEAGCLQYDLHRDNENPAHFMFYEIWESREMWQKHIASKHLQAFMGETEGAIEKLTVHKMTKLD